VDPTGGSYTEINEWGPHVEPEELEFLKNWYETQFDEFVDTVYLDETWIEGELQVTAGDMEFAAKPGDVWSCGKGSTREAAVNNGTVPAVMRTIYLKAA
jgi:ethanolamine utilization protein EutQ (cupin superfamily)